MRSSRCLTSSANVSLIFFQPRYCLPVKWSCNNTHRRARRAAAEDCIVSMMIPINQPFCGGHNMPPPWSALRVSGHTGHHCRPSSRSSSTATASSYGRQCWHGEVARGTPPAHSRQTPQTHLTSFQLARCLQQHHREGVAEAQDMHVTQQG